MHIVTMHLCPFVLYAETVFVIIPAVTTGCDGIDFFYEHFCNFEWYPLDLINSNGKSLILAEA